jgi:hypothetical protein
MSSCFHFTRARNAWDVPHSKTDHVKREEDAQGNFMNLETTNQEKRKEKKRTLSQSNIGRTLFSD